jgi:hypothetical protein
MFSAAVKFESVSKCSGFSLAFSMWRIIFHFANVDDISAKQQAFPQTVLIISGKAKFFNEERTHSSTSHVHVNLC